MATLLYIHTMGHYFLSDDFNGVYRFGQMSFKTIFAGFTNLNVQLYRPFIPLFNKINFVLFGDNPLFWNLINLILNLCNTILFFYILRHFLKKEFAFFISLLFLVNFSHTEAVVWMSGRTTLLISMVFLISSLYFIKFIETKKKIYFIISVIVYTLGFFTKENIFVFPLVLVFLVYTRKSDYRYTIPYFVIMLLFAAVRIPVIYKLQSTTIAVKYGFNFIKNAIYIFSATLIPLNYAKIEDQFAYMGVIGVIKNNPSIILLIFVPFIYYFAYIKSKKHFLIIFTIAVILSLPVIFLPGSGERYLYLPSTVISIIIGYAILTVKNYKIRYTLLSAVIIIFSTATIIKGNIWNRASYISHDIVNQTGFVKNRIRDGESVYFKNLPDSYEGAYVLRNGIDVILKYIDSCNVKITKTPDNNSKSILYSGGILRLK